MNDFYQQFITDKSYLILQSLKKRYEFILIGGWAVYLYTHTLKSKDIDIIIDFAQLDTLRKDYHLTKNIRLKKYEINIEEIDIDIYLPHFSNIGIAAEEIMKYTDTIEGFILPKKEILIITKQKAYAQRKSTIKGLKDRIDIISLICEEGFDFGLYKKLLEKYKLFFYQKQLIQIISETYEIPELEYNRHSFAKKKRLLLDKLILKTDK